MNLNDLKLKKFLLSILIFLLLLPAIAISADTFRFIRMWPALQQPWYFNQPQDAAVDSAGYVYVADTENHRILKFTANGQFVGQWEIINGGSYYFPTGIAADGQDNVYVVESQYVHQYSSDGRLLKKWELEDVPGFMPWAIETDATGLIYVADQGNACIHVFTQDGTHVGRWGEAGSGDGQFYSPSGIAVDASGFVYVTDLVNHCVQKFEISTATGNLTSRFVTRWGVEGNGDGQFDMPFGITADNDYLYVVDMKNDRVQKFDFMGNFISKWGQDGSEDGNFYAPSGIVTHSGQIYVVGKNRNRIQKFTRDGDFLTNWESRGSVEQKFEMPSGIDLVEIGTDLFVFVTDKNNHRIQKFDGDGRFLTSWGGRGNTDGLFDIPYGIAANDNFVYVTDSFNHRIQKFDLNGGFLARLGEAGTGEVQFHSPEGIDLDATGNLYVADTENHRVQVIQSDGTFIKQFDTSDLTSGNLYRPHAVLVTDVAVFIADDLDQIHQFNLSDNHVRTWGGTGSATGEFNIPLGLAADNGFIYVADSFNNRIQRFDASGNFDAAFGRAGSGPGLFQSPGDICIDSKGKIYIADRQNNRIQVFEKTAAAKISKAIVVAGGGAYPGNTLWNTTRTAANFAIRTLSFQGFTSERIQYLTSDTQLDLDNDGQPDAVIQPSFENLESAVLWGADADTLVVYLVNHGGIDDKSNGIFRISEKESFSAAQLDICLDEMQKISDTRVILIYDACKSGSFISASMPPGGKSRLILTSTSFDENAYFISQGSNSFSGYFWSQIFNGLDLRAAFEYAQNALLQITQFQHPMINCNGNAVADESEDFLSADGIFIGNGITLYGDRPIIENVTANTDDHTLIMEATARDQDGIVRVWANIRPPDYDISMTRINGDHTLLDLPSVELQRIGFERYRGTYDRAYENGSYRVTLYASDREGNISLPENIEMTSGSLLKPRAILIAGKDAGEENTDLAYSALRFQGYGDDAVYYLSHISTEGVDASPSLSNVQYAIESWAVENTLDLTIYITGKGLDREMAISDSESLSSSQLDKWIDTLQSKISGIVTVIYDGDYSGSFIPSLTPAIGKKRIVITSTGEDSHACFLSEDSISFSDVFWKSVFNGSSVGRAYSRAVNELAFFAGDAQIILPMIDDNGNGIANERTDGMVAANLSIGLGIKLAENLPIIGDISPDIITTGVNPVRIWAREINAIGPIMRVWAVIVPPDRMDIALNAGFINGELPPLDLIFNPDTQMYEGDYQNFSFFGLYRIGIYAQDLNGSVSLNRKMTIYKKDGQDIYEPDNTSPQAGPIVIGEPDAQSHNFHYEEDEDWLNFYALEDEIYTLQLEQTGKDADIELTLYDHNLQKVFSTTSGIGKNIEQEWNCPGNGLYYLKIRLHTPQIPSSDVSYNLRIYQPLAVFAGFVKGMVMDSTTGNPISNAVITTSANASGLSRSNGRYLMIQEPGTHTVTIKAAGYQPLTMQMIIGEGGTTISDFQLTPNAPPPVPTPPPDSIPNALIASPSSNQTITAGKKISFSGMNTGGNWPFSWYWNFNGAADNAFVQNPGQIVFDTPGIYTITFTVTDADGDTDSHSVTITVTEAGTEPVAEIISPDDGAEIFERQSLDFQGNVSSGNPPFQFAWNFTRSSESANPESANPENLDPENLKMEDPGRIVFETAGNYTVVFAVTDSDGDVSSDSINIIVNPKTPEIIDTDPAVSFVSPSSDSIIQEGESIRFEGNVSEGNKPLSFFWNFGGGAENSNAENPGNVVFSYPGIFNVKFIVTDADKDTAEASMWVTVKEIIQPQPDPPRPDQPVISYPLNESRDIFLSPTITIKPFAHNKIGYTHTKTMWQISMDSNFSTHVLNILSSEYFTDIHLPELLLKPDTSYYLRTQFIDNQGNVSEWSAISSFKTAQDNRDENKDDIPDDREVDQENLKCIQTGDNPFFVCVKPSINIKSIEILDYRDPETVSDQIPENMIYGLIGFRAYSEHPGDTAEIIFNLSESVPSGSGWVGFDTLNGWQNLAEQTSYAADNQTVILKIKDGGDFDADGTANGIIVLLSGPGIPNLRNISVSGPSDGNVGGTGCFINTMTGKMP